MFYWYSSLCRNSILRDVSLFWGQADLFPFILYYSQWFYHKSVKPPAKPADHTAHWNWACAPLHALHVNLPAMPGSKATRFTRGRLLGPFVSYKVLGWHFPCLSLLWINHHSWHKETWTACSSYDKQTCYIVYWMILLHPGRILCVEIKHAIVHVLSDSQDRVKKIQSRKRP